MVLRKIIIIIGFFLFIVTGLKAQTDDIPDFTWGNTAYFNLNKGESIQYLQKQITLLSINNLCNKIKVGNDTVIVKVCQGSLPLSINDLRLFVADNKNLGYLTDNIAVHGLLSKDVLIAVNKKSVPLLNENYCVFPVSFNEGFTWDPDEDNHVFSLVQSDNSAKKFKVCEGVDFDLLNNSKKKNQWMLALEDSKVVWIIENTDNKNRKHVNVLLESESQPEIFYYYGNLYKKNLEVRKTQKLRRGELIGTSSGENDWGRVHFSVIKSDTIPGMGDVGTNVINFFPQLFELYFNTPYSFSKMFSKGTIEFGTNNSSEREDRNISAFEDYAGKGWLLGCWNILGKVPFVARGNNGNVRLSKILFVSTGAESANPKNYYDYEITVKNGTYRIRAKVGDLQMATWQKVQFENIDAGEFSLENGEQEWTSERIVKVNDGKITVRIFIDQQNKTAGLGEIVFQRVL